MDNIKTAMADVTTMATDRSSWPKLDSLFKLATQFDLCCSHSYFSSFCLFFSIKPPLSSPGDISVLASTLSGPFAGVVQYNNDTGKVVYNWTIKTCFMEW